MGKATAPFKDRRGASDARCVGIRRGSTAQSKVSAEADYDDGPGLADELDVELSVMLTTAEPERWRAEVPSAPPPPRPRSVPLTSDLTLDSPPSDLDPAERRRAERYPLTCHVVRARVLDRSEQRWSPGRVRDVSGWGGLYIETSAPLPFKTDLRVDFVLGTGHELRFVGRVVRRPDAEGMAVQLRTDPARRVFLNEFIDEVLCPDCRRIPSLTIRPHTDRNSEPGDEALLEDAWQAAVDRYEDTDAQQRFIEVCLSQRRIDYALQAYRKAKVADPDDKAVDPYLEQLGTILGFYALTKVEPEAVEAPPFRGAIGVVLVFVIGVIALWVLLQLAS